MSCSRPYSAFKTGNKTENGKDEYFLDFNGVPFVSFSQVEKKFKVNRAGGITTKLINGIEFLSDPLAVPCGKCFGCRMDNAKEWKVRACLEMALHKNAYFITLTYDDAWVPQKDGLPSLCKEDLRHFFVRLRRHFNKTIRFLSCGEYGETYQRPHYHIILFGDFLDDLRLSPGMINHFHSPIVSKLWPYGLHDISIADSGCISYVAGYVEKKQLDPHWQAYPVKPFRMVSRKPPLGFGSFRPDDSFKVYGSFGTGSHCAKIPRAYAMRITDEGYIEAMRKTAKENGIRFRDLISCVFDCVDWNPLGDLLEYENLKKLAKCRKEKLKNV